MYLISNPIDDRDVNFQLKKIAEDEKKRNDRLKEIEKEKLARQARL